MIMKTCCNRRLQLLVRRPQVRRQKPAQRIPNSSSVCSPKSLTWLGRRTKLAI